MDERTIECEEREETIEGDSTSGDEWVSACGEGAAWDDRLTATLLARRRAQGLRADAFLFAASAREGFPGDMREQHRLLRLLRQLHAQGLRGAAGDAGAWLRLLRAPIGQRPLALLPCGSRGARLLREGPLAQVVQLAQVAPGAPGALLLPLPPFAARRLLEHAPLRLDSALLVASLRRRGAQAQLRVMEAWRTGEGRPLELKRIDWEGNNCSDLRKCFKMTGRRLRARADLRGVTFRVVTGYRRHSEKENFPEDMYSVRLFGELWTTLGYVNNFTTIWTQRNMSVFGGLSETGEWKGIMKELVSGRADVAACEMSVTSIRKQSVDFLDVVFNGRIKVYVRRLPRKGLRWTDFLLPFRKSLWAAAVGAALVLAVGLAVDLRLGAVADVHSVTARDAWLFVAAAFCQQSQRVPRTWSGRVLCVCAHLVALVLAAAHSGSLISALSASSETLTFHSITEALDDPDTRFAVTRNSGIIDVLHGAKFGDSAILWNILNGKTDRHLYSPHVSGMFQHICSDYKSIAFSGSEIKCSLKMIHSCTLEELPNFGLNNPISLAIVKNSSYTQFFSYFIRRMRRVGVLAVLIRRHWPHCPPQQEQQLQPSVRLMDVGPLFAALGAGAMLALLVLTVERCFPPLKRQSRYQIAVRTFQDEGY